MCPYGHLRLDTREEVQEDMDMIGVSGHRKSLSSATRRAGSQQLEQSQRHRDSLTEQPHLRHLSLTQELFDEMSQKEQRIKRFGDIDRFALLEGLQQVLKEQLRLLLECEAFWKFLGKYYDATERLQSITLLKERLGSTVKRVWLALVESLQLDYWQEDDSAKDNDAPLPTSEEPLQNRTAKNDPALNMRKTSRMFNRPAGQPFNRDFNVAVTLLVLHVSMQLEGFPVLAVDWPRLIMCHAIPFMDAWRLVGANVWSLRLHQYQRRFFRPRKIPVTFYEHMPAFLGRLGSVSLLPEREFDLKPILTRLLQALYLDGTALEDLIVKILHIRGANLGITVKKGQNGHVLTGTYFMHQTLGLLMPVKVLAAASIVAVKMVMLDQSEEFQDLKASTNLMKQYQLSIARWKSIPMLDPSQPITDLYAFDCLIQVAMKFTKDDAENANFKEDLKSLQRLATWKDLPAAWAETKLFDELFDVDMKSGNCNSSSKVTRPPKLYAPRWQMMDDTDWSPAYSAVLELAGLIVDVPKSDLHEIVNFIIKGR